MTTTTRYTLDEVSGTSRYGRRVTQWADIAGPDTEVIITLPTPPGDPYYARRSIGRNLRTAARNWGAQYGYTVTTAAPRDWSELSITFKEVEEP